jgi:hypothetical protein
MKLIWIGAFVLLFASLASLISNQQSGRLIEESWTRSTKVLPEPKLNELQRAVPAYTHRIFLLLPEPFRERFAAKMWKPVELMTIRSLLLWHLTPGFLIPLLVGFLEGSWARVNQNTLIKMHSPMRFSMSLTAFCMIPVLAVVWITAPIAPSATFLVFTIGALLIVSTRNLIVHAPTQF